MTITESASGGGFKHDVAIGIRAAGVRLNARAQPPPRAGWPMAIARPTTHPGGSSPEGDVADRSRIAWEAHSQTRRRDTH